MLVRHYNEIDQRVRYHTFLACLFAVVKKEVDTIISEDPLMTYDHLSSRWRMHLRADSAQGKDRSRRGHIYQEVVDNMKVEFSAVQLEAHPLNCVSDRGGINT